MIVRGLGMMRRPQGIQDREPWRPMKDLDFREPGFSQRCLDTGAIRDGSRQYFAHCLSPTSNTGRFAFRNEPFKLKHRRALSCAEGLSLAAPCNGLSAPDERNGESDDCCTERQNNAVGEQELALTSPACLIVGSVKKAGTVASADEPDGLRPFQASEVGRFAHPGAPRQWQTTAHGDALGYRLPGQKS